MDYMELVNYSVVKKNEEEKGTKVAKERGHRSLTEYINCSSF